MVAPLCGTPNKIQKFANITFIATTDWFRDPLMRHWTLEGMNVEQGGGEVIHCTHSVRERRHQTPPPSPKKQLHSLALPSPMQSGNGLDYEHL